MPFHFEEAIDEGKRGEPVLHYSTKKPTTTASEDQGGGEKDDKDHHKAAKQHPYSIYDEKYLQLDKKVGQEYGRLTEHEHASSGFSSASSAGARRTYYPKQRRRSHGHRYEGDAPEWYHGDYRHRRGGERDDYRRHREE